MLLQLPDAPTPQGAPAAEAQPFVRPNKRRRSMPAGELDRLPYPARRHAQHVRLSGSVSEMTPLACLCQRRVPTGSCSGAAGRTRRAGGLSWRPRHWTPASCWCGAGPHGLIEACSCCSCGTLGNPRREASDMRTSTCLQIRLTNAESRRMRDKLHSAKQF
jgi:hypothetical protein